MSAPPAAAILIVTPPLSTTTTASLERGSSPRDSSNLLAAAQAFFLAADLRGLLVNYAHVPSQSCARKGEKKTDKWEARVYNSIDLDRAVCFRGVSFQGLVIFGEEAVGEDGKEEESPEKENKNAEEGKMPKRTSTGGMVESQRLRMLFRDFLKAKKPIGLMGSDGIRVVKDIVDKLKEEEELQGGETSAAGDEGLDTLSTSLAKATSGDSPYSQHDCVFFCEKLEQGEGMKKMMSTFLDSVMET